MDTPSSEPVRRRRRGAQLESELLDSAWDELVDVGYANLTMESVATRARTGIAVLYRRWANKDELVLAAIEHYPTVHPSEFPDTGSLRSDLLGRLASFSETRATFVAVAAGAGFSGLMAGTGLTPAQVRQRIFSDQPLGRDLAIYQRAQERGELDLDRVPAEVLALPFDLVRHDLLMNLEPLRPARIRTIVDELFLPLVAYYQSTPAP